MRYLIKRCGHQELGSMTNGGRPSRGQYLLVSMAPEVLSMFPPLSKSQFNDYRMIPLIPLYANTKVYCRFVYHNDKYHGSTAAHPRNEMRLYLNKEAQGGRFLFKENGIIIFRPVDDDIYNGFYIDYIDPSDGARFAKYNRYLDEYGKGSPHPNFLAMEGGMLGDIESKVSGMDLDGREAVITQGDIDFINQTPNDEASLFNEVTFRDFLLVGYEKRCAITRTSISHNGLINLEAAHILPKAHGGSFMPCNGMMLCRDMHWAFDHGFITLTEDLRVEVSKKIVSDYLMQYDGTEIFIPKTEYFRPKVDSIRWHRKNVFEHFGSIRAL